MVRKSLIWLSGCLLWAFAVSGIAADDQAAWRPPAVPLVVHDPYFSIWSPSDKLAESWPRHWTGTIHALCGMVRIDGKTYRIMGAKPGRLPAMEQVGLRALPGCSLPALSTNSKRPASRCN